MGKWDRARAAQQKKREPDLFAPPPADPPPPAPAPDPPPPERYACAWCFRNDVDALGEICTACRLNEGL